LAAPASPAPSASPSEHLRASATELAEAIATGRVTSRDVVETHIEQLERAQPRTNAIAADRYEAAREEADRADERVRAGGELPPLHGVPCTVKECFALKGMPQTAGLVSRRDFRAEENAPAVQRLLDAGAIPVGVTNTSELCMWWGASDNKLYGRSSSAYSRHRTSGGSSGGEGAAVGSGGSPFGLGSDIGGSIRIPAFFNGVFGHKPTPGLVPNDGQFPCATGGAARMLATGPLARRAEDLMPLVRVLSGRDDLAGPETVAIDGLPVLGVESAWAVPVRPDVRHAVRRAAEHLGSAGAVVEEKRFGKLARSFELLMAGLSTDEAMFRDLLGDGRAIRARELWPEFVRGRSPHTLPSLVIATLEKGRGLTERHTQRLVRFGERLAGEIGEQIGDGVLLYPTHPTVVPLHHRSLLRPWGCAYAGAFNVMGFPVTQVPLGLNDRGLPTGVQVAARPGNDHVAIAVALELQRRFGGWVPPR
jgi:fatty acid amide hydrolase 2